MIKRGLGRGLEALLPGALKDEEAANDLKVSLIEANPNQPRKVFEDDKIAELAASIREHGVVQPIIVRPIEGGKYQLIAGERRWRAARLLGLTKIPAVIKHISEAEAREISLVENLQREDLNPLEEAEAYRELLQEYAFTQEGLAKRMGKSRPYIANALRLLGLSEELKQKVRQGTLTTGHAKVLLGVTDVEERDRLGRTIVEKRLSVREAEQLVRETAEAKLKELEGLNESDELNELNEPDGISRLNESDELNGLNPPAAERPPGTIKFKFTPLPAEPKPVNPEINYWEERIREKLGTKVKVKWSGQGAGTIEIQFYGLEDLERIDEVLGGKKTEEARGSPAKNRIRNK
jgi:ParB family chromosome partitioning protein